MRVMRLICLILILTGCGSQSTKDAAASTPLYIEFTRYGDDRYDSVYVASDQYLQFGLRSVTKASGKTYIAQYELKEYTATSPVSEEITVCDQSGTTIQFVTPAEFLNHMIARGYDLVTEEKNKYGGDYTFKKI